MRQDVLRIFESLDHFQVSRLHGRVKRVGAPLSALVHVGHHLGLRAEHDLSMVLEVDLDDFVGQTEHDSVPCAHPLLDIYDILDASRSISHLIGHLGVGVRFFRTLQVASEVLQ